MIYFILAYLKGICAGIISGSKVFLKLRVQSFVESSFESKLLVSFVTFNTVVGVGFPTVPYLHELFKINYIFSLFIVFLDYKDILKSRVDVIMLIIWLLYAIVAHKNLAVAAYGFLLFGAYRFSLRTVLLPSGCLYAIILISGLSIFLQMMTYRYASLPSMFLLNPNFTGVQCFLWIILLSAYAKHKKVIVFSALGLLTKSRSYVLSITLLFLFKINSFRKTILKLSAVKIWLLSILLTVILGEVFLYGVSLSDVENTRRNNNKSMIELLDRSNYQRFMANRSFYEVMKKPDIVLKGFGDYPSMSKYYRSLDNPSVPHNGSFKVISLYGMFSMVFFYFLMKVFSRLFIERSAEVIAWIAYAVFLMKPFEPQYVIFFVAVCMVKSMWTKSEGKVI